ncbi:hypothetical protein QAD02_021325 [Eretmocerus hayati]|uniref:Uncharacterized protein n=1 Tax=Eretmocerus hayati TaxID=131215 RepID=A0ACC2PQ61_9HYME|nr:hypothetical protein QAD02_021325 [Eretmocerus hayati]
MQYRCGSSLAELYIALSAVTSVALGPTFTTDVSPFLSSPLQHQVLSDMASPSASSCDSFLHSSSESATTSCSDLSNDSVGVDHISDVPSTVVQFSDGDPEDLEHGVEECVILGHLPIRANRVYRVEEASFYSDVQSSASSPQSWLRNSISSSPASAIGDGALSLEQNTTQSRSNKRHGVIKKLVKILISCAARHRSPVFPTNEIHNTSDDIRSSGSAIIPPMIGSDFHSCPKCESVGAAAMNEEATHDKATSTPLHDEDGNSLFSYSGISWDCTTDEEDAAVMDNETTSIHQGIFSSVRDEYTEKVDGEDLDREVQEILHGCEDCHVSETCSYIVTSEDSSQEVPVTKL